MALVRSEELLTASICSSQLGPPPADGLLEVMQQVFRTQLSF
jgi:hypothetical protein